MGFLMHFSPFSVKKIRFSDFFRFRRILRFFDRFFLTICLILGFPSPLKPRFPTGPPLSFYIKNMQKIGKKSDFRCRPPKTDSRFLIYAPKHIYLKKIPFFMYFCLSNTVFPTVAIRMYRSSPLVALDSCLTAAACLSSACSFAVSQASDLALLVGYVV